MTEGLRLRSAVRALVLDAADRVLLVRFELPDVSFWAAPGGGIEHGERDDDALRRELAEEAGLHEPAIGPLVWTRTHVIPLSGGYDGQTERYYLVRTAAFEVRPGLSASELFDEGVTGARWWTLAELRASGEQFAPRRLPSLLSELLTAGPPDEPLDVGV